MSENVPASEFNYTRKDFQSDRDIRWCPGCGDYSIFNALTSSFAKMNIPKEKFAVISGIGCSSRYPYYSGTYGFHTLHGRAPTIAMGTKLANPELAVWVITGDGDALSIGGNHFIHLMRRNPNIKMVLFNNQIYGLTKGQASPTTQTGKKTKTSPLGLVDHPIRPLTLAIAAGATFVARVVDTNAPMMRDVFIAAQEHKGVAMIETLTNCMIFNDGVFTTFEKKDLRKEHTVELKHGEPLIFGAESNKGIVLDGFTPKAVVIGENGVTKEDILVHDAHSEDSTWAEILSKIETSADCELPLPLGIFRSVEHPVYEEQIHNQEDTYQNKVGKGDLDKLLHAGETWEIDANGDVIR